MEVTNTRQTESTKITPDNSSFYLTKKITLSQKFIIGFSVPLLLILGLATANYQSTQLLIETNKWVQHTQQIIARGHLLEKLILTMETGERGFLITGKDSFLQPFIDAKKELTRELKMTRTLVIDNPEQIQNLTEIERKTEKWLLQAANPQIAQRRKVELNSNRPSHIENLLKQKNGKNIIESIRINVMQLDNLLIKTKNQRTTDLLISILKDIIDQETGTRSFLITGEEQFLEPYTLGKYNLKRHIKQLKSLLVNVPNKGEITPIIVSIETLSQRWLSEIAKPKIAQRRQLSLGGTTMADIVRLIENETGKKLIEDIQFDLKHFIDIEKENIKVRSQQAAAAANTTLLQTVFGSLLAIIAAFAAGYYLLKTITLSLTNLSNGTRRVAKGDFSQLLAVQNNDEIGELAKAFNHMIAKLKVSTEAILRSRDELKEQASILSQQNQEIEITNADLLMMQAELEQKALDLALISQYKSNFLATMSHEIRTPMNGVLGMLGLLLKAKLNNEQRRKAKIAYGSAESLLSIINDILDFSKIEAGKLELELINFNLRTLIEKLTESMAPKIQEKGLEIVLDIVAIDLDMVVGDPGRIRQVLTNLIGNAMKFTETGEIIIRASLETYGKNTLRFNCQVHDTGIGIRPEQQSTLFDTFTQIDASTTRKYGGTGLGLSIAKKLCELMAGDIKVNSSPGLGSCFSFNLQLQTSTQNPDNKPNIDLSKLKLLIVDPNNASRKVLRDQLKLWGGDVTEADTGAAALAICQQSNDNRDNLTGSDWKPFDIALLDIKTPKIDGVELVKKIKADPSFKFIKLILMSSISSRAETKNFAGVDFDSYLPKPSITSNLHHALAEVSSNDDLLVLKKALEKSCFIRALGNRDKHINCPQDTRLLLVEDNQVNQLVAKEMIEDFGLTVDIASNGIEALHALKLAEHNDYYSLVLMDCQMPEMDGYAASRAIRAGRAGNRNSQIGIIAITANAMVGDRENCLAAGMNDYMSKPLDPDKLQPLLQKWLVPLKPFTQQTKHQSLELENQQQNLEPQNADIYPVIWDQAATLKRLRNKPERLQKLIEMYLEDMPARVDSLQQAVIADDFDEIYHLAHTIKGVVGNLSADLMYQLATNAEAAAKAEDSEKLMPLAKNLQRQQRKLEIIFKQYLQE